MQRLLPVPKRRVRVSLGAIIFVLWSMATTAEPLTLQQASQNTLRDNPALQVFAWREQQVRGLRQQAALSPAYELELEAENFAGTGAVSGFERAEYTLSLSSVIELGEQREARTAAVDSRLALIKFERQAQALKQLARVQRVFVATLALQYKRALSLETERLAETALEVVSRRVASGAAPEAERWQAQATLERTRLRLEAIDAEYQRQRFTLTNLWGGSADEVDSLAGELFHFARLDGFATLWQRADQAAPLQQLAAKVRLQEALVQRERGASDLDVSWSLGVKQFADSGDTALTAGVSAPLFSARRNRGAVQATQAERGRLLDEEQVTRRELREQLFSAWSRQRESVSVIARLQNKIIPSLTEAAAQMRIGYEKGRYRYLDWVNVQKDLLNAELQAIDAATLAHTSQAFIEQLTAQSFVVQ